MKGELVRRDELEPAQRSAMLALLGRHFDGVDPAVFERDLLDKQWVVLVRDERLRLRGFSTLRLERSRWSGEPVTMVYSGDTIVDPSAWRSTALVRTWIDSVWRLHAAQPHGRLYWLLLTSGPRTYRLLSVFWREFHPRFDRSMPADVRAMRDHFAVSRHGDCFDPRAGVVRFTRPHALRPHLARIERPHRPDPHLEYFLRVNPGHASGSELVCLAELSASNLTAAGRRVVSPRGFHVPRDEVLV